MRNEIIDNNYSKEWLDDQILRITTYRSKAPQEERLERQTLAGTDKLLGTYNGGIKVEHSRGSMP